MTLNIKILYYKDPDLHFDIADLPDPMSIVIPICITNNEDITLYFRAVIANAGAEWRISSADLGSVDAGDSVCFLARFLRYKPSLIAGEYDETITLRIEAYTDSGYTELYGYQEVQITIHYIDHYDPAWTIIDEDNFDDASLEDWKHGSGAIDPSIQCWCGIEIESRHYVSPPYSLGAKGIGCSGAHEYKDFNTSGYSKAYLIMHVWSVYSNYVIAINYDIKIPAVLPKPTYRWTRWVIPLPAGAIVRVQFQCPSEGYIDDVFVIGK